MTAEFYAEDLGICLSNAEAISSFVEFATKEKAVTSVRPWAKYGKARVYIEFWSQNSLSPIESIDKAHYDCESDDIFISQYRYGMANRMSMARVINLGRSNFSGAKTRESIKEFGVRFYEQKKIRLECPRRCPPKD